MGPIARSLDTVLIKNLISPQPYHSWYKYLANMSMRISHNRLTVKRGIRLLWTKLIRWLNVYLMSLMNLMQKCTHLSLIANQFLRKTLHKYKLQSIIICASTGGLFQEKWYTNNIFWNILCLLFVKRKLYCYYLVNKALKWAPNQIDWKSRERHH